MILTKVPASCYPELLEEAAIDRSDRKDCSEKGPEHGSRGKSYVASLSKLVRLLKNFVEKELHVLPGSAVGILVVFEGVHTMLVCARISETVPSFSVNNHLPIDPCFVQSLLKLLNMGLRNKWVCMAMGNEHFGLVRRELRVWRER